MPDKSREFPDYGTADSAYVSRMVHVMQESFLTERYWPGVTRPDVATAEDHLWRAADKRTVCDGIPIRILSSTWIPADEVVLTLFGAGEQDDVLEVCRLSDYAFDRIQAVEVATAANRRSCGEEHG